jgi:predicted RNA-binding protein with PUA-like domain
MHYWLLKTEPGTYSWDDLVRDKATSWTGVRNFSARIHLRAMMKGDHVFVYHSGEQKAIVGVAKITKPAYPDATAKEGEWVAVEITMVKPCKQPVTLGDIKKAAALRQMVLVNNSRLSVQPVTAKEWAVIARLAGIGA